MPAKQVTESRCVIFYHGNDWEGTPARQKYLMQALSCYVPIIYLDSGTDRKGHVTIKQPSENVTVVRGLIFLVSALLRRRLDPLISFITRWHLWHLTRHFNRIIFWDAENFLRPYRYIQHDVLIFDCIDPAFVDDPCDLEAIARHEAQEEIVLRDADLVFATAALLAENCRRHHQHVVLLNNACEPEEYEASLVTATPMPAWWPTTRSPIGAYLGTLDWRVDFALLEEICRANPEVHFIVAGYVLPQYELWQARLGTLPNVTCPGKISVADGRYLLANCSFGLIPFTAGTMNDAINPVKMYAYALLAKPIVGTCIRELKSQPEIVATASTPEEFTHQIKRAISLSDDASTRERLKSFALENTWRIRSDQAWEAMKDF